MPSIRPLYQPLVSTVEAGRIKNLYYSNVGSVRKRYAETYDS